MTSKGLGGWLARGGGAAGILLLLGSSLGVQAQPVSSQVASLFYTPSLDRTRFSTAELVARSEDITITADPGTRLRLYEVQVAKLVETTHFLCTGPRGTAPLPGPGIDWTYRTSSRALVGRFRISCTLANSLASAYGFLDTEPTRLGIGRTTQNYNIPALGIAGPGKVSRFINWVWSLPRLA